MPDQRGSTGRLVAWAAIGALTFAMTALTCRQALSRYAELRTGWSWDLAYYNQWFWAVTHGIDRITVRPLSDFAQEGPSVWKTNYLAPVRFLIAPLYRLRPDPTTLLLIQSVVFWWTIPAVFTLARSESGSDRVALAASALVPLTPLLWPLAWNDFRELQLAMPFVLWAVQGVRGRTVWLSVASIGALLACRQEFAGLVASLAVLRSREQEDLGRRLRWAHVLITTGVAWVLFAYFGFLHVFVSRSAPLAYMHHFTGQPSPPITGTAQTAAEFLALGLGGWLLFLPWSRRVGWLIVPWLWNVSNGLWSIWYLGTGEWHHVRYTAPLMATGVAAGVVGFSHLARGLVQRPRGVGRVAALWLLAAFWSGLSLYELTRLMERIPTPIDRTEARDFWEWAVRVEPDDGVVAAYEVSAPLSSREQLFSFVLDVNKPKGYPTLGPSIRWVFYENARGSTQVFTEQGFEVVHSGDFLTILKRPAGVP
jgi:hypothetical protein